MAELIFPAIILLVLIVFVVAASAYHDNMCENRSLNIKRQILLDEVRELSSWSVQQEWPAIEVQRRRVEGKLCDALFDPRIGAWIPLNNDNLETLRELLSDAIQQNGDLAKVGKPPRPVSAKPPPAATAQPRPVFGSGDILYCPWGGRRGRVFLGLDSSFAVFLSPSAPSPARGFSFCSVTFRDDRSYSCSNGCALRCCAIRCAASLAR